ncbi:hypothetical protein EMIHUDRAFT_226488 [Emiliania huxleyi CCMP1516]|uniref:OCEL domain-containing protein n=2 Tax=Emiliania huxleyi TaxID=2903 RepID=A0A0D3KKZ9_EMIH1|nr:hypothetical protein EMIHUDRAFT_226488 [Emiliania huxleyi CCMP1516]EOD36434.1 hypothetical protein EMIHUDRAFT_226488 [Emiliania huxleyi CCMP1516]|eukprot:XP_005788863.1 hypothetical protein EMIHUDRAFT_226488 [Emiliania huxleyi CCMP1516]
MPPPSPRQAALASDMYDCVCHILALEPQWVADALEAAVRAMHERVGRAYRRDLYLKQLKQVAICPPQLAASAVCKLKPHVGAMVREDWPHYTPEQRGRLQSLRKAAEAPAEPVKHPPERRMPMEQPAGKPAGRQPAGRFRERYRRYRQLDALFTGLDDKVRGASCEDARREAEARLVEAFRAKKRSMLQQTQEYRALHVELKRLKAAVNGYVERAPKTAVAL